MRSFTISMTDKGEESADVEFEHVANLLGRDLLAWGAQCVVRVAP
jgi:hypothetical protein